MRSTAGGSSASPRTTTWRADAPPAAAQAAAEAVRELGAGSGAVRTIAGTLSIARGPRGGSWPSSRGSRPSSRSSPGFAANTGSSRPSPARTDLIVSATPQPRLDHRRHAPVEGAPQGLSRTRTSPPCRAILAEAVGIGRRRPRRRTGCILVVTDGVFSMDGDICPLPDIVDARPKRGRRGRLRRRCPRLGVSSAARVAGRSITSTCTDGSPSRSGRCPRPSACLGGYVAGPAPCASC